LARQVYTGLALKDEYIAGLWKRYLYFQLLWEVQSGNRTEVYRVPGWSWASIGGMVYNHRTNQNAIENTSPLVRIQAQLEHKSNDCFGEVKLAALYIIGPMIKVSMRNVRKSHYNMPCATLFFQETPITEYAAELVTMPTDRRTAHCLFICWENEGNSKQLIGLLLEQGQVEAGHYRRLERFHVGPLATNMVLKIARSFRLSESEYVQVHENNDYEVVLI